MDNEIAKRLKAEVYDDGIRDLLEDIKKMLRRSRAQMKKFYPRWDRNLQIFKGLRIPDEQDYEAISNDEPAKLTVPLSYTQVMTFVTFVFMLYKQNPTFFQMDSFMNDQIDLTETAEDLLETNLRYNYWNSILFQSLLDAARYGFTATKTLWDRKTMFVNVEQPGMPGDANGIGATAPQMIPTEALAYEGNIITKISPYRAFPDMTVPLVRWREGRFFADETEFHIRTLDDMELSGKLAGCKFIEKMNQTMYKDGEWCTDRYEEVEAAFDPKVGGSNSTDERDFMCISTEGHFKLIPSKYGLGPETRQVDFLINVVNDQRIVRIERINYLHGQFVYDLGQFIPDVHNKLGLALCDQINAMQEVVTFLFNTRVLSIRQGIEKHIIVDPTKIEMVDVEGRSPIIRVKKNALGMGGIAQYVQQLKYVDGTQMHLQEADQISRIIQTVTGVNENAMGQYAPGRRSAAENRAANSGAASRMTMHASLLWEDHYAPLGFKMLMNLRQGLSMEMFQKVLGNSSPTPNYDINTLYQAFCCPHQQLVGSQAFFTFDATSPSERVYLAQSLQELLVAIMSNPQSIPMVGYDPAKLIDELQFLRGVRNTNRFKFTAEQRQAMLLGQSANAGVPAADGSAQGAQAGADANGGMQGAVSGGATGVS